MGSGPAAGRLAAPWRLGPLALRRRAAQVPAAPSPTRLVSRALGFAGSSEEDALRRLTSFRRLLDGLDQPLQILIRFTSGREAAPPALAGHGSLREADLAFLRRLDADPAAQSRCVELVGAGSAAEQARGWLRDEGLLAETIGSAVPPLPPPAPGAGQVEELPDHLCEGGRLHRTWYVDRFPGIELAAGWLHRLAPPACDAVVACHLTPLPTAWMVEHLQRKLTAMRAARLQESAGGSADPLLAGALPTVQTLQAQLVASQERAFQVGCYVTVSADGSSGLAEAAAHVEAAARALLCTVRPCTFRMLDGFAASQPAARDPLGRGRVLHSSAAVTLYPWLEAELREPDGIVVGRSRATRRAVQLDPFDRGRRPNANIGVFGHSGAGKTYLMSTLAMGAAALGVQVLVIDPEHEYGRLARALGGVDVPLALGSGVALNVLDLRPGAARDEGWLGPAAADAVDLVATLCGGLDESQRAGVDVAVRGAFRDHDEPLLRDVAERLDPQSPPARVLRRWVEGSLGAMFSAPTNIDLDAPVVVFGMRELRDEMIAPVHFLLAEALWSRIKARGRRRLLFVDELGILFEDPTLRRFVVNLARRIRKYEGGLVFATQNPGDLLASEAGSVVATNPAIHFFGSLRPGEALKVQRVFQLSDRQRSGLETARRGEFLLATGAERVPVEVLAAGWQSDILASAREPPGAFV